MNLNSLRTLSYGMTIISSIKEDSINAQIANTVFQITSSPVTIGISINKENLTYEYIKDSHLFTLSVLTTKADFKFVGKFGFRSGRDINKFDGVDYILSQSNVPIVTENACAWFECKVINSVDCGSHVLFIGEVIDCDVLNDDQPMTYDYYHNVLKGKSPKAAPTYIG